MFWIQSSYVSASPASDSAEGELTEDMVASTGLGVGVRSEEEARPPLALCRTPPERRRSFWVKLEPRPDVEGYGRFGRLGRLGYDTAELREVGDMPAEEALGEWPDVYDMLLEGGVTAGVPPVEWVGAVSGDATWAAVNGSTGGRVA